MAIRLIDTETLQMKMFVGASIPRYAILSHTWVEGEEVDFQEMTRYGAASREHNPTATEGVCTCACRCQSLISGTVRRRSGYEKIVRTCTLAKRRGIGWAWVDTCCIDKSSSAELSEAINSMYKWYSNAKLCFVFLADLDFHPESDLKSSSAPKELEEALGRCRWFTRGWTLQELIAPRWIEFYNRHWMKVGTHGSLHKALEKASGISNLYIGIGASFNLDKVAVAEKMKWASRRQTTRVEDMAYCLLGIFDIHMPLLYGEGEEAFRRLQEEILKRSNDTSIFCTSAAHTRRFGSFGRDALAISPKAFDGLPKVEPPNPFTNMRWSRATFSVTNRGLLVQNAYLIPCSGDCAENSYYVLELNCTTEVEGSEQQGVMFLQWLSPSRYVRLQEDRPLPRCVITRGDADSQMGLTEDFYILTCDAYVERPLLDYSAYTRYDSWVELDSGPPPSQLRVVQASPPQYWDVAARRFVETGLGYAKAEITNDTIGRTLLVATFYIAFQLMPEGEFCARLYSTDEWQEVKTDFDRLSRGNGYSRLPAKLCFKDLGDGDASDWLSMGTDLGPFHESGFAPVRARATVAQLERGNVYYGIRVKLGIELLWRKNDGTYSSEFSAVREGSGWGQGKDAGQAGGT